MSVWITDRAVAGESKLEQQGCPQRWIADPPPGGWVCAAPDPDGPDGECGMPVESEPCPVHYMGAGDVTAAEPYVPVDVGKAR